jgi:four helix bundle protein
MVGLSAESELRIHNDLSSSQFFDMKKELEARTKRFALSIIHVMEKLPRSKTADVIGYQLLKSGTSIGANYREANRAQSRDDFIHKVGICEREASETGIGSNWLKRRTWSHQRRARSFCAKFESCWQFS